jgi:hypothetical protein
MKHRPVGCNPTGFIEEANAMTMTLVPARFLLGDIVITRGALEKLSQDDVLRGLIRHMSGDWGQLDEHDRQQNEAALAEGCRLLSRYTAAGDVVFWIITEHDRSVTTILLPEEY